jgi:chromosome partitioning protein
MIVALLNQKGGVGKTTLATHIAGELAMRGQHVVLLDADPQGSSLDWTQRRSQQGLPRLFSAVGLARETLHQEAPELARRADHVIIDGPPRIAALARSALLAAERVLIPVQPSPYDLWASAEMVALIREAQVFRPRCARPSSSTGASAPPSSGARRGNRWPNSRCPRCARKCISASSSPTAWPLAGSHARPRPTAPPPAKSPRWWTNCCGGRHDSEAATTARTGKRVGIGARPPANPHAEAWIRQGDADALGKGDLYTARLTLDITPAMRARIKVSAFTQGVTVADLLRGLLEREFPPRRTHHERIRLPAARAHGCAAPRFALAGQAGNVPLTRVALAYIEPRFKLYLRFGEPARTLQLDRWRRCAVFLPNAMFCRIRWQANDYGTIRWQLMVMQAARRWTPRSASPACSRARLLLHAEGDANVRAVLERIDGIEALGIAARRVARVLAHAREPARSAPGAARIHRRAARRLAGREGIAMTTISTTGPVPHPRSRLRARLVLAGFATVGLAALAWAAFVQPLPRLTYNPSDSVAVGWYRIEPFDPRTASLPRPLSVDSIVLVPLPDRAAALRSAATCRRAFRCSNVWARSRRNTFASSPARFASTACRWPPPCLPTGWAGRCHPCSFAAASNRANCSC